MRSGRPRRLLGPTVGAAVALSISALVVWGVALWVSWGAECPAAATQTGGLGKGNQAWPPAVQCVDRHGSSFWHQPLPWAPWAIGILVAAAAAILLTGLIAAIRDLRQPAPASSPRALELLDQRFPGGGRPDDAHRARGGAADAERDPPAMAA